MLKQEIDKLNENLEQQKRVENEKDSKIADLRKKCEEKEKVWMNNKVEMEKTINDLEEKTPKQKKSRQKAKMK